MATDSTVSLQDIVDIANSFGDIEPILNVGGMSEQPALSIANDVMNAICAAPVPRKWNEILLPLFYTNSFQQDYALIKPSGLSVTNLSWLERGIVVNITSSSQPKPYRNVEVGRQLPQATGSYYNSATTAMNPLFFCNWFPNKSLYYGTWGQGDTGSSTLGNNPVSGSEYIDPLTVGSQPANPIIQIRDANDNLLVLTGYGTEGTTAPVAPADSLAGVVATPGAGATTTWTVVDPDGQGIRILPVPSQTGAVWEFNLVGQARPVRFTSLTQKLSPLPDELEPNFRAGFIAQCYRYSREAKIREKFKAEWALWQMSLLETRTKEDREQELNRFVPERGVMAARWGGRLSPARPFNNPGPF